MVTITADFIAIDNCKVGWTIQEGEEDRIYFAATDADLGKTFLVGIPLSKFEAVIQVARDTIAKASIQIANPNDMPGGQR